MKRARASRGPAWGTIALWAALFAGLAALWRYTPLSEILTPENITDWARDMRARPWAPVLAVLAYTPAAFIMFPRPLITLANVIAFGPWLGFAYSLSGILVAALATYYAGRLLPQDTVHRIAGERFARIAHVLRRHGLVAVLAVRLVPVAPFVVEAMVAGAIHVKLWHYMVGTALGMAPGTLTTSVFGTQIAEMLEDPARANYWLIGGVALVFIVIIWVAARWMARQGART